MSLNSRLARIEATQRRGRWLVIVTPAEPGYGGHRPGGITFWPTGDGCTMTVPAEFEDTPLDGLDDRQRYVLQHGDRLDVHSFRQLENGDVEVGGEHTWNGTGADPIAAPERRIIDEAGHGTPRMDGPAAGPDDPVRHLHAGGREPEQPRDAGPAAPQDDVWD